MTMARHGFMLTELLVVISVIAVLMTILMPTREHGVMATDGAF